uniref:Uncharacterized protein n=1 Tax=Arundo donax TaxID=35708 RepID=A0A0A9AG21_ARUDO
MSKRFASQLSTLCTLSHIYIKICFDDQQIL